MQAAPLEPQLARVGGTMQVLPLQQPPKQDNAPQLPQIWLLQLWLGPQSMQAAPIVPQALDEVPSWHWPVRSQQPVGQLVLSQTQVPALLQCWPTAHEGPLPQLQTPLALQLLLRIGSQVAQLCEGAPHAPSDCIGGPRQLVPSQQPLVQDAAEH